MSNSKQYITRKSVCARFGNMSPMTLWRWERDSKLGFPSAIQINGRRYYDLAKIEIWERTRSTASKQS